MIACIINNLHTIDKGYFVITQSELKKILRYNPSTGVFTWIKTRGFVIAGTVAGGNGGAITYKDKRYLKKRLAWLYMTGIYPNFNIYAIDDNNNNLIFNNLTKELLSAQTINKNHVDINCIVNDNSYSIFIIEKGVMTDLGMHDDADIALQTAKSYLCSK